MTKKEINVPEQYGKFKKHLRDNKNTYIVGGVCFVVGAAVAVIVVKSKDTDVSQKVTGVFYKSPVTQIVTKITIDAPGNAGNVIQDLATGTIYPSIGAAAKALDISKSNLSQHLNGKYDHAGGKIFKLLVDGGAERVLESM